MRVLILAHDFPPLNTIGGRRPFSWFRYFPENGIHPVVITKSWEDASSTPVEIVSQHGASDIQREENGAQTIIRVPLKKSYSEKLLATYGEGKFVFRRKASSFLSLVLAYPFSRFDKNFSIYQAADQYLSENKVDWIIATGEPFILFKYAHRLGKKYRIPWVADYRDGWYLNHNRAQQSGIVFLLHWQYEYFFEKKYLRSAAMLTSVDPLLSGRLGKLHDKKSFTLYNGFEELSPPLTYREPQGLPLTLCYSGTLYPGHQAEILLQALKELHDAGAITPADLKIQFVGLEFYPDQLNRVINFSPAFSAYIETTRRIPRDEAKRRMQLADFLLVFSDRWTPVLPSKMYESIASRRPVLAIPNDHSILAAMITDFKAGIVVDSVEHLKSIILEKIEAKRNHLPLFHEELDLEKAMKFSREYQAKEFAALLKAMAPPLEGSTLLHKNPDSE